MRKIFADLPQQALYQPLRQPSQLFYAIFPVFNTGISHAPVRPVALFYFCRRLC